MFAFVFACKFVSYLYVYPYPYPYEKTIRPSTNKTQPQRTLDIECIQWSTNMSSLKGILIVYIHKSLVSFLHQNGKYPF
jgi:hypothetical protein